MSAISRSQASPHWASKTALRSSGNASHFALFIDTWKVVVPKRALSGPSIWYWVVS